MIIYQYDLLTACHRALILNVCSVCMCVIKEIISDCHDLCIFSHILIFNIKGLCDLNWTIQLNRLFALYISTKSRGKSKLKDREH